MTAAITTLRLIGFEQRCFWRNPAAAVLMFALPLVLLFILGGALESTDNLLTGSLTFGILMTCYSQVAFAIVQRRDDLFLKRLRATPLRKAHYMTVLLANAVLLAAGLSVVIILVARFVEGVRIADRWGATLPVLVVGAATFCALGLAMSAVCPNEEASPAVLHGLALPMVFLGTFFPISSDSILGHIAGFLPTRHLSMALHHTLDVGSDSFPWWDLAVLGIWFLLMVGLASWRFRWEPKH